MCACELAKMRHQFVKKTRLNRWNQCYSKRARFDPHLAWISSKTSTKHFLFVQWLRSFIFNFQMCYHARNTVYWENVCANFLFVEKIQKSISFSAIISAHIKCVNKTCKCFAMNTAFFGGFAYVRDYWTVWYSSLILEKSHLLCQNFAEVKLRVN